MDWKSGQSRKGVCDFGHISNEEYRLAFTKYRSGEWSLEQLKEHEFNFKNFQIKTISSNRSGRFEGSVR
ncbi:GH-E family nuclease [Lancefieldella rimae]